MTLKTTESKSQRCYPFFHINPYPTKKEVIKIGIQIGCSWRTVYRALDSFKIANPELYVTKVEEVTDLKSKVEEFKKKWGNPALSQISRKYRPKEPKDCLTPPPIEQIDLWSLPDKDLKDTYIKFVGYRGHEDKDGYAVIDPAGAIHEGIAIPEPIDEITGDFMGIAQYQADYILTYRDNDNIANIWGRGMGKTWSLAWIIEITMMYMKQQYLFFSLTEVAYKVANDVYVFGNNQDIIMDRDTVQVEIKKKTGRQNSYQKFSFVNGSRYEVHGITTASTLGFHGWTLIMDDIIDEQHQRLKVKQKDLVRKWNSQYSKIRRVKLVMNNTRKFSGDFFDFIFDQFEEKNKVFYRKKGYTSSKYTLHISHKTPYTEVSFEGKIKEYREFLHKLENNEIPYNPDNILSPWYSADDIEIARLEDPQMFDAEYMGNPRPLKGGMVTPQDIHYIDSIPSFRLVEKDKKGRVTRTKYTKLCGIGVDTAETESEDNDQTAVISGVMFGRSRKERKVAMLKANINWMLPRNTRYTVNDDEYESLTEGKFDFYSSQEVDGFPVKVKRGISETIQLHVEYYRRYYPNIGIIIAMERSLGGIVHINNSFREAGEQVEIDSGVWCVLNWSGLLVKDPLLAEKQVKAGSKPTKVRYGVTHRTPKTDRVYGELQNKIKKGQHVYLRNLENSLLVKQTCEFPSGAHDDGVDADGMITDELWKRWGLSDIAERAQLAKQSSYTKTMKAADERFESMKWGGSRGSGSLF